ncbi:MAG: hypothetical protein EP347_00755 [Alphaproteobacteria bacterium]|nr:MAG: hypothetical protein EP347_00755 [Alphaproteobacteria bacterium]
MIDDLPDHYTDLTRALEVATDNLAEATSIAGHPMKFMSAATHNSGGFPQTRLLTIRAFDPEQRCLSFFSDLRTPKIAQLAAQPQMQLLAYDPDVRIQLRLDGLVTVIDHPEPLRAAWERVPLASRRNYISDPAPGFRISDPTSPHPESDEGAFDNFTILEVTLVRLDWLYLHIQGNRRAEFIWRSHAPFDKPDEQHWLVP